MIGSRFSYITDQSTIYGYTGGPRGCLLRGRRMMIWTSIAHRPLKSLPLMKTVVEAEAYQQTSPTNSASARRTVGLVCRNSPMWVRNVTMQRVRLRTSMLWDSDPQCLVYSKSEFVPAGHMLQLLLLLFSVVDTVMTDEVSTGGDGEMTSSLSSSG
ncbi:uncharacterized protein LY79DRAFT_573721 [Colletotrichum navitas]|uniref:Uncharacterized protein n=1 Tax=Colletotrichum navitas TaxID=681940 RepID=A0AAD8PIV1_9PEZI|nr:uncharacterized protein LY79DRAFT_573721 [Colletotrichum navitas]KAK1564051.1 hypothetical protein LY79DRAFT_573721 [Colletotrichum navitas]